VNNIQIFDTLWPHGGETLHNMQEMLFALID